MSRIWKISPGYNADLWDEFKRDRCIAIGNWGVKGLGDLRKYSTKEELKEAGVLPSGANQLWKFYKEIEIGNIIIAYSEKCIWGIGKVTSEYYFADDDRYWAGENYIRNVEWKEIKPPLNVSLDRLLFGEPPRKYGILNKQLTVIEIGISDWNYIVKNYPVLMDP